MFEPITATFAELKAQYPHMMDPINRWLIGDYFDGQDDDLSAIADDQVFHCIEFTRLQFMAWATGGPLTETLSVTMCEDLVRTTVTHVVMDSMLQGD